ncbi:MAG TPA: hypothetical protein VLM18_07545 [Croceibacterium sp.]|nr:hypothetical protein [Croceibacterium sp.]
MSQVGVRDAIAIVLVCVACSSAYAWGLRYYSDDYLFLVPLRTADDQSWVGLYRAIAAMPFAAVRPGQILWYVALHKFAHDSATVSHIANHMVFALSAVLLQVFLRRIPATRVAAYYLTLLYVCLPTFSVAKMWYANHQAVISLAFFALTCWLVAIVATGPDRTRWRLVPLVALTAAAGNLFYELFAITELFVPLFVWCALRTPARAFPSDPGFVGTTVAIGIGFVVSTVLKLNYHYGFDLPADAQAVPAYAHRAAAMYYSAAKTTFWTLGFASARAALGFLHSSYLQPTSLIAPLLVLAIIVGRELLARLDKTNPAEPEASEACAAFYWIAGIAAFVLGYVPYLTNFLYSPKPWGEGNRGNIAGALGAALLFYSAYRWMRRRTPVSAFALLAMFCFIGAFLQVAVGKMWVRAALMQDRVLARFDMASQGVPDRASVLIYGSCPYYGAGPVFPYGWDIAGRERIATGRRLTAAIVLPGMQLTEYGVATPQGRWTQIYAYRNLWIVDLGELGHTELTDLSAARAYFLQHPLARSVTCRFDFGVGNYLVE